MNELITISRVNDPRDVPVNDVNVLFDPGSEWDSSQGEKFLLDKDNILLLAYSGGVAVGFLTAHRLQRLDKRNAEILLYEIGVHEEYQNRGIGKALMSEVKKWGKEVGADEMWVLTHKSNPAANALYRSTGGSTESDDETMYVFKL